MIVRLYIRREDIEQLALLEELSALAQEYTLRENTYEFLLEIDIDTLSARSHSFFDSLAHHRISFGLSGQETAINLLTSHNPYQSNSSSSSADRSFP